MKLTQELKVIYGQLLDESIYNEIVSELHSIYDHQMLMDAEDFEMEEFEDTETDPDTINEVFVHFCLVKGYDHDSGYYVIGVEVSGKTVTIEKPALLPIESSTDFLWEVDKSVLKQAGLDLSKFQLIACIE